MLKSHLQKVIKWIKNQVIIYQNKDKCHFRGTNITIENSIFEGKNMVADGVSLINCYIGYGSYINQNSRLIGSRIGKYCSIADHVFSGFGHHPLDCISTHPAFFYDTSNQLGWEIFNGEAPQYDPYKKPMGETNYSTIIGHDVWIGSHVMLMDGVRIGNGAVVGTGSVVVKDIPPYAIVAGVPAKIIRYRQSFETIKELQKSKWWNHDIDWIKKNMHTFNIRGISFLRPKI